MEEKEPMSLEEMYKDTIKKSKKKRTMADIAREKILKAKAKRLLKMRKKRQNEKNPSIGKQINFPGVSK